MPLSIEELREMNMYLTRVGEMHDLLLKCEESMEEATGILLDAHALRAEGELRTRMEEINDMLSRYVKEDKDAN